MSRYYNLIVFLVTLASCGQKAAEGMPPTQEWQANQPGAGALVTTPPPAGHAPHGMIGTDVTKLGLPAPDPARPLDPSHRVAGKITVKPDLAAHVKDGGAVFVIVKREQGGVPNGPPLAVTKLTWQSGLAFELTERNAMIAGTELTGSVIVTARFDQDGDALTKQPGDLVGQIQVTVPADALSLVLDTVLP